MFKFLKKWIVDDDGEIAYQRELDDLQEEWSREVEKHNAEMVEALNKKLGEKLEKYNSIEDLGVTVESGIDDRYISVGDIRGIPCKNILKVSIEREGYEPYIYDYSKNWTMGRHAKRFKGVGDIPLSYYYRELPYLLDGYVDYHEAVVCIYMKDNLKERITCKHREVYDLRDRIIDAWINGVSTAPENGDV